MARIYRSAQGKQVDMERLRLQNELIPAVGNMRVNARGDQLGPGGKVVQTREEMLDDYYKKNTSLRKNESDKIPTSSSNSGRVKKIQADSLENTEEVNTSTTKEMPDVVARANPQIDEIAHTEEIDKNTKSTNETTGTKSTATKTATTSKPAEKTKTATKKEIVPPSLKEADAVAETADTDDSEIDLGKKDKNSGLQGGETHIKGGLAKAIQKTRDYEQRMGRGKPKRI